MKLQFDRGKFITFDKLIYVYIYILDGNKYSLMVCEYLETKFGKL